MRDSISRSFHICASFLNSNEHYSFRMSLSIKLRLLLHLLFVLPVLCRVLQLLLLLHLWSPVQVEAPCFTIILLCKTCSGHVQAPFLLT